MKPLLSLCIPIYNRLTYLERQLERMLEDKDLFEEQIQLIISDNCSSDDLQTCCEKYQKLGLKLYFHRNETNLGPDENFEWCFHHADGKYVWLLGSDDIPVKGMLRQIVDILGTCDYGLVHLSTSPRKERLNVYHNDNGLLADISVWITFLSANIILTASVKDFDLTEYEGSFMIQVPAYLNACLTADYNAITYLGKTFEDETDSVNNGGYNLFQVFVENLFGIYQRFIAQNMLSQDLFEKIKKDEYKNWLSFYVIDLLIFRTSKRKKFKMDNATAIIRRHYGKYPYFYYYTIAKLIRLIVNKLR